MVDAANTEAFAALDASNIVSISQALTKALGETGLAQAGCGGNDIHCSSDNDSGLPPCASAMRRCNCHLVYSKPCRLRVHVTLFVRQSVVRTALCSTYIHMHTVSNLVCLFEATHALPLLPLRGYQVGIKFARVNSFRQADPFSDVTGPLAPLPAITLQRTSPALVQDLVASRWYPRTIQVTARGRSSIILPIVVSFGVEHVPQAAYAHLDVPFRGRS